MAAGGFSSAKLTGQGCAARAGVRKRLPSPLADTVAHVADACRARHSQKCVQLQVEALEMVAAAEDTGQLQQALINLVMNAVEASPASGRFGCGCTTAMSRVCVDIENRGAPIPEAARWIFKPFFTTRPLGRRLGLGRNIVRAHGGDLTLAANSPRGFVFR